MKSSTEQSEWVLIVDDEVHNRILLFDLLRAKGFNTLQAESGEEALLLTNQQPPDVIILDVMMPGMNGFEVCNKLKNNAETAHIPVMMLTGLVDQRERISGLEAGAIDFMTKPFDIEELCLRVKNLAYHKRLYDQLHGKFRDLKMLQHLPETPADPTEHQQKNRTSLGN